MSTIVALDSGALIGLGRNDRKAVAIIKELTETGHVMIVPAPVLSETLRGGRGNDASIRRWLNHFFVKPLTEEIAQNAGHLLGANASANTVDAMIVATAHAHAAVSLGTTDRKDISKLLDPSVEILDF